MLRMLNTNLNFFWTLLWLDNPPAFVQQKFTWGALFKADNLHETMYVLEIVESFLVNDYQMLAQETEERKLREVWLKRFVKLGGFQELVKLTLNAS